VRELFNPRDEQTIQIPTSFRRDFEQWLQQEPALV